MTPAIPAAPPPCVSGCVIPGAHAPDATGCGCVCHRGGTYRAPCDVPGGCGCSPHDPECRGCKPRQSVPGGLVCVHCWETTTERLPELPDLYVDLLTKATGAPGERVSGGGDSRPLPIDDAARICRDSIATVLLEWRMVLSRPAEPTQADRDEHAHRLRTQRGEPGARVDPLPEPPYGRGIPLPTSTDPAETVRALTVHAGWLMTREEYAADFVAAVNWLHGDATKTAVPGPRPGLHIGHCPRPTPSTDDPGARCGGAIRLDRDGRYGTCHVCGRRLTVWAWRRDIARAEDEDYARGTDRPKATAAAIAAWLSALYGRTFRPDTIGKWHRRGTTAGRLTPAGEVREGRTLRTLYLVDEAERIAAALYGPPAEAPDEAPAITPPPVPHPPARPEETPHDLDDTRPADTAGGAGVRRHHPERDHPMNVPEVPDRIHRADLDAALTALGIDLSTGRVVRVTADPFSVTVDLDAVARVIDGAGDPRQGWRRLVVPIVDDPRGPDTPHYLDTPAPDADPAPTEPYGVTAPDADVIEARTDPGLFTYPGRSATRGTGPVTVHVDGGMFDGGHGPVTKAYVERIFAAEERTRRDRA